VDSEFILGSVRKAGYKIVDDIPEADIAIINTCSFIKDAKEESIDTILNVIQLKKDHTIKKIIVAGCLPERYLKELKRDLPEVDGFFGTGEVEKIAKELPGILKGERRLAIKTKAGYLTEGEKKRSFITPKHFAYLKIAEGCSNCCNYCVIPNLRGPYQSRKYEDIIKEAQGLVKNGVVEINVIAQDTTRYGLDLYGKLRLAELLKDLSNIKGTKWIRLLYTHPAHFTDELIQAIKKSKAVCKYIDLPIQHISLKILKKMNRKVTKTDIISLIKKIRKEIPGIAIRSSLIVGFPGETEADFDELYQFVKKIKFERLGIFTYSREEGTRAYKYKNQLDESAKETRREKLLILQQEISRKLNQELLDQTLEVLIDEDGVGRTRFDAPEVDGLVYVKSKKKFSPGDIVKAKIIDTMEYDLVGESK